MTLASMVTYRMMRGQHGTHAGPAPTVKHGAEILAGPYPQSFEGFVGQLQARAQIVAAITSAATRGEVLDHILLASGQQGIGKTTLGRLTAHLRGVGFVELGGNVTEKDVAAALKVMERGDVLFLDEVHRLVSRGKAKAEWLLTLLQDGELHLPTGVVTSPGITIIAATTDVEKLPETIIDRFGVKPQLFAYTPAEGKQIAEVTAARLGFGSLLPMQSTHWLAQVTAAADGNPRRMGNILASVRDIALADSASNYDGAGYDIDVALRWNGLTPDGLTQVMQDYLVSLYAFGGTAGSGTLKAMLSESQLVVTEKHLVQRGFIEIGPRGRSLTDMGTERATQLGAAIAAQHELDNQPTTTTEEAAA